MSEFKESYDEMIQRQEKEMRNLAEQIRQLLKSSKKGNKSVIEAQTIQMQFDLKAKHREEEEIFDNLQDGGHDNILELVIYNYSCSLYDTCLSYYRGTRKKVS
jgi:hypothetical protein